MTNYRKGSGMTETFLVCILASVTYVLGNSLGYDRGFADGELQAKKKLIPSSVVFHPAKYFDMKGNAIKKGKLVSLISSSDEVIFGLDEDQTWSNNDINVYISRDLSSHERKKLEDFLNKIKEE